MPKYKVSVEKRLYCTGTVEVIAKNADKAQEKINNLINKGKLQTTSVDWGDPQYEDLSFNVTGDVD
jgi:hypothetical protein